MSEKRSDHVAEDPHAELERALIAEFLARRGLTRETLQTLPVERVDALLRDASLYASGRLTEVESRAHLMDDLHRAPQPPAPRRAQQAP